MEIADKIFEVFRETLQVSDDEPRDSIVYQETKNWDSIAHMTLVAGLEEAFDCMLDTDDILDMSSFNKAVEIMGKYQ
jgi:acyl carrier protein